MQRAHKIALDPTNKQATALARAAGTARFAYNWALARWGEQYQASLADPALPKPSQYGLRKELNSIKREAFPWMLESSKCAPQEAIIALGTAFKNFFAGRAKYPTFKKRGIHDSFKLSSGQFKITGKKIRIPNIGWVRLREELRYLDAKQVSVTISRTAGRWFASVQCEIPDPAPAPVHVDDPAAVGVDVGVREYVLSDDTRYSVPRHLRHAQARLKRSQQALARKEKGSANRAKARVKVARLHAQVADARSDWLHQLTTRIASTYPRIVIEDLNVAAMAKNHHLAMSITDASFGEFRRQLAYKTPAHGSELVIADRWFPSSKLCSVCGAKTKHLTLSQREWTCQGCGTVHDRDLNAAKNLATYPTAGSSSVAACGALLASDLGNDSSPRSSRRGEAGTKHHDELVLV